MLFLLFLFNLPLSVYAGEILISLNSQDIVHGRMPGLSGTVSDKDAFITVIVGDSYGIGAVNNGDGTWELPQGQYGPFEDGTCNMRVTAENFDSGDYSEVAVTEALTILDDYTMAPELETDPNITADNEGVFL